MPSLQERYYSSKHHQRHTMPYFYSPKLSLYLLSTCVALFILFQIQSLQTPPSSSSSLTSSWRFRNRFALENNCTKQLISMSQKLRDSVTFLPLKDLRFSGAKAQQGHTWFMSSTYDTHEEGEVQFQQFPSRASNGRILCIKGRDNHDGSWNYYALAWPEALPQNATLKKGLTFISYNHYNYDNIWHGLSAMVPFVAWHIKNGCDSSPDRWVLYHWGELRMKMGNWLTSLMEATFGGNLNIEGFDDQGLLEGTSSSSPSSCFEEAVVMRHNEGGMSRLRRMEVYDLMRCKARSYCNVSKESSSNNNNMNEDKGLPLVGMTLFMRSGPRSFRNESKVIQIFEKECRKVGSCRLMVAYSNNISFCEQVKLMSLTDILISPHGAQLTNMFLMDRNSSVMEFFPKGWLKLAGVGQYVYHWIASWSGMNHQGAWRDPFSDVPCPFPDDDRRCMSFYKGAKIGYNETYFSEWATSVLNQVKMRKMIAQEQASSSSSNNTYGGCSCK